MLPSRFTQSCSAHYLAQVTERASEDLKKILNDGGRLSEVFQLSE